MSGRPRPRVPGHPGELARAGSGAAGGSGVEEAAAHPLLAASATRLLVAVTLSTFPSNALTDSTARQVPGSAQRACWRQGCSAWADGGALCQAPHSGAWTAASRSRKLDNLRQRAKLAPTVSRRLHAPASSG